MLDENETVSKFQVTDLVSTSCTVPRNSNFLIYSLSSSNKKMSQAKELQDQTFPPSLPSS